MLQRKPASMETEDMDGMWLPGLGWPQPGSTATRGAQLAGTGRRVPGSPPVSCSSLLAQGHVDKAVKKQPSCYLWWKCRGIQGTEWDFEFSGRMVLTIPRKGLITTPILWICFFGLSSACGLRLEVSDGKWPPHIPSWKPGSNRQRQRNHGTKSYWYFPGLIKARIES